MILTAGERLGPYEIVAPLGTGGMGVVYRAHDPRVGRDVAVKISAERFSQRFEREARAIAALNHPNICALYDVGPNYLVLELVDGQSPLGAQPLASALRTARQLVDALEAAHERGVIHRDLKPSNIKVTRDGVVKVLDFGLAKMAADASSGDTSLMLSTDTVPSPDASAVMGTAAYMAPEQVRGEAVDRRVDIWAFGVVLYQMLTGKRPFQGGTATEVLAAVAHAEPDWGALPPSTPQSIRRLLRRCLEKDPKRRLPNIGVARLEIDEATEPDETPAVKPRARRRLPWLVVGGIGAAALAVTLVVWFLPNGGAIATEPSVARFVSTDEPNTTRDFPGFALSPDGRHFVYAAGEGGLYSRAMADLAARLIPGTEGDGASNPVFSPDGRSIAFFSGSASHGGAIKVVAATGGSATSLLRMDFPPFGMSWGPDGIVVARSFGKGQKGLFRLSPRGGPEEALIGTGDEFAHGPHMLPDGRTVLFTLASGLAADRWDKARIVVQSLSSGERKTLIDGGADARYLSSGHIVYARGSTLLVAPLDLRRLELTGDSVPIVEGVKRASPGMSGAAQFAVSSTGTLVYASAAQPLYDLAIIDRAGEAERLRIPSGPYQYPRVSPDGSRIIVGTQTGDDHVVWVGDLNGRGALRRLTFDGRNRFPIWSPDGERIIFQSDREGDAGLFWQRADGTGSVERLTTPVAGTSHEPEAWSPSGDYLLFRVTNGPRYSLWMYSLRDRRAEPFGDVESSIPPSAVFSPDGRWVAYCSREADKFLVSVQPFPPNGTKYQVAEGGIFPVWSRNGRELFYFHGNTVLAAVNIVPRPVFTSSTPVDLWPPGAKRVMIGGPVPHRGYDPTADGRFLSLVAAQGAPAEASRIHVVINWFEEIRQRFSTRE